MSVDSLFHQIPVLEKVHWNPHRKIRKITSDSRLIEHGDIFIACRGSRMDGHDFIGQAIQSKASVVVCEQIPDFHTPQQVVLVRVENSQVCLAHLLNRYYGNPSKNMKLIGVTGTNGKTTIAYLLHSLLREKLPAACLGTLWYDLPSGKMPAVNTTPGVEILIPLLNSLYREKVPYCVMEVSSHALDQRRVCGVSFELAIFTQLTQDHLDYHHNMESYFRAKKLLFESDPHPRKMLINRDCPYGRRLLKEYPQANSFGILGRATFQAEIRELSFRGSRFWFYDDGKKVSIQLRLPMRYNVSNALAVLSALKLLGFEPGDFRGTLQEILGIPGRLERIPIQKPFDVFVDYAHTPDAVENVLSEARFLKPKRILTLIGCGGDRDRSKRPQMAEAACRYSDVLVLTSDNPRSEDPEVILTDVKKGIKPSDRNHLDIYEILDRKGAIDKLISLGKPGDVLFILGKGHEDYQILGEQKIPFDDRLVARECLERKSCVLSA